ncbi:hypothetical protein [Rhabdochlamydiaceae symbiont of Dictyostelium giganteum]|uniref:hypothetical protein n=1 Tax=Rhabdochlamydiaceae symbiont of Dictyostelium giganteum TaxID=3342349 RepID=UPI00384B8887
MGNISACITTGILEPNRAYQPCKVEYSYHPEKTFFSKVLDLTVEECQEVDALLTESFSSAPDETVWKQSLLMKMALSPRIHAMTFMPTAKSSPHVLFIQKMPSLEQIHSLIEEKEGKRVIQNKHFTYITEKNMEPSLEGMDEALYDQIKKILTIFLRDSTTSSLEIAYFDQHGYPVLNRWSKREENEAQFSSLKENITRSFDDLM